MGQQQRWQQQHRGITTEYWPLREDATEYFGADLLALESTAQLNGLDAHPLLLTE